MRSNVRESGLTIIAVTDRGVLECSGAHVDHVWNTWLVEADLTGELQALR